MAFRYLFVLLGSVALTSCSTFQPSASATSGSPVSVAAKSLVGAWEVNAARATRGVGKNLLTFSSDGTFFRSGDTHPVLSGAHGAWKTVAPHTYEATYVSFSFDQSGKWTGINRNNLRLQLAPNGDEMTGDVKSSTRDLEDKVLRTSTTSLSGKRIQVQPF